MTRRHARLAIPSLAAAALAAGCLAPAAPTASRGASIKVFARLAGPVARDLKVAPAPRWTAAEVSYVRFQVFQGASTSPYLSELVDGDDIRTAGTTLTFTALAANTTYRIEARAYHDVDEPDGGEAPTLISVDQAPATTWKTTVAVGTDDAPTPAAALTLQLVDRVFDGTSTLAGEDLEVRSGDCTFAIQGAVSTVVGGAANQGQPPFFSEGGQGLDTAVFDPGMMVRDSEGTIYVCGQHQVFMITSDRTTYLLGGGGTDENGVGTKADTGFNYPKGLALSADERELYVADFFNGRIIGIDLDSDDLYTPDGTSDPAYSRVVAGGIEFVPIGLDGARDEATIGGPSGLALAPDGALLVTSYDRGTIRRIDLNSADPDADAGYVTTIAGANNDLQYVDDDADAKQARLASPFDIEPYKDGFLIADHGAAALRKLTPLSGGGWGLTTFATTAQYAADASGDRLIKPRQLAVDPFNRVWFTDREDDTVGADLYLRCLDPDQALGADARLRTWIGGSQAADTGYADGHAADATFGFAGNPAQRQPGVAIDRAGTVFFTDPSTNSVRKLQ